MPVIGDQFGTVGGICRDRKLKERSLANATPFLQGDAKDAVAGPVVGFHG